MSLLFDSVMGMIFLIRVFLTLNYQVKQNENEAAVRSLPSRLNELDNLTGKERQVELIVGLIAGNYFDWGAHEVVK